MNKNETYRIEGNTLIINEGVTAVDGKDFHIYENDIYSSVKEEFKNIRQVILPDSVTEIGTDAFCDFLSLEDIALPNGITNIGYYAFAYCSSLENITIPDKVVSLGACAFENCINLSNISLPNSVGVIDVGVFEGCEKLMITCNEGSIAEEYAIEENIPFKHIKDIPKTKERG